MNEINFEIKDVEKIDLSMDVGIKEIFPPIENLEVNPSKEQQVFNHENSYGYDNVIVNTIPDEYIIPDGTLPITENKTYDVRRYARVSASVYPTPNLQDKNITITENGTQNITFDEGYDGLNSVEVTTNVEAKSLEINNRDDMTKIIVDCVNSISDEIQKSREKHSVYTDEPVTIYSPVTEYNNYLIRYRSGQYSITWFPDSVGFLTYDNSSTFNPAYLYVQAMHAKPKVTSNYVAVLNSMTVTAYTSSSYSSLEKCIEALRSSSTSYSTASNSNFGHDFGDYDGYDIPLTNMPYFRDGELKQSRKLSANETIVVIE